MPASSRWAHLLPCFALQRSGKLFPRCRRIGYRGAATASLPAASCSVASPDQQQLSHHGVPASNIFPMAFHHGAPASNKPHLAEKSTPSWLAIWRTWAGFANSQLISDAAALSSMQGLPRSGNFSAQTSASLHPPAALRLRVLPFTRGRALKKSLSTA